MTSHRTTFGIRPGLALAGLLAVVLGVVGCGLGGSDEVPAPTLGTIGSTTTTTTTDAGTGGADDGPEAGDDGDDIVPTTTFGTPTTTTIVGWTGAVHPLTALPAVDGVVDRPALAVKIGNNDSKLSLIHI